MEVSEKICRLRPIEEPAGSEQKKTANAIRQEVARESVERVAEAIGADIARGEHQGGVGPRHPFRPRGKAEEKNETYVLDVLNLPDVLTPSGSACFESAIAISAKSLDKGAMFDS